MLRRNSRYGPVDLILNEAEGMFYASADVTPFTGPRHLVIIYLLSFSCVQFSNPSPHSTTPRWVRVVVPIAILSVAWIQELVDNILFGGQWKLLTGPDQPFWSIILSWFSHTDFGHLIANTTLFLPLSWLVLWKGARDYASILACVFLVELVNQLFWPEVAHGISDIAYGLLGYLVIIGFLERRFLATFLSALALVLYGKYLPALLPWNNLPGVSWLGHFSGFVGGIIGAFGIYREPNMKVKDCD